MALPIARRAVALLLLLSPQDSTTLLGARASAITAVDSNATGVPSRDEDDEQQASALAAWPSAAAGGGGSWRWNSTSASAARTTSTTTTARPPPRPKLRGGPPPQDQRGAAQEKDVFPGALAGPSEGGGKEGALMARKVSCTCAEPGGVLRCAAKFLSLVECHPRCASACRSIHARFRSCNGPRSVRWFRNLGIRFFPCRGY
mmetsp:Transcript_66403/g.185613  ORF Transcript_66403/g.185613 Transcript_66403/m.185613 type:complete len:202 (-) Transcript_66403:145-750(-)